MIVDVISGFRQSGKTSLVRSLAEDPQALSEFFLLTKDALPSVEAAISAGLQRRDRGSSTRRPGLAPIDYNLEVQLLDIAETYRPQRLIIEPSAPSAVPRVLEAIRKVSIEGMVRRIRRVLVVDGSAFGKYYASSTRFTESQVEIADLVVVNKCDLVQPQEALWIQDVIGKVNQEVRTLWATFGKVDGEEYRSDVAPNQANGVLPVFELCTSIFNGAFDVDALTRLFEEFRVSSLGRVSRAKGTFRTTDGWVQLDYVNGGVTVQRVADAAISRIALIGVDIEKILLGTRLNACLAGNDCPVSKEL